jgi:uncharacterized protein (UPF0548 family)
VGERRPLGGESARRALDELHAKSINFDLARRAEYTEASGWHLDDYCQPLPSEPPGPPVSGGSWQVARRLMERYEFADPSIVRAVYFPERPLAGRDMLLEGRFLGLRFRFGCRVGGVIDAQCIEDGRRVRVWGWNYRTLQDHLEMGEMDYEVWKWLDDGAVEFRIHAFSKPAFIRNPLIRLGFWLFGRGVQLRFARRACERMLRLTEEELARRTSRGEPPRASRGG